MKIKTWINISIHSALLFAIVSCGGSSDSRKAPKAPIPPGGEEQVFGCSAVARKNSVGIPVENGSWVARPTAYATLTTKNALKYRSDEVSVSVHTISPDPFGATKLEVLDDQTWKFGFRPSEVGVYEVTFQIQQNKSSALCKTKIEFTEFPAEENVIYIDEEWLDDSSNGTETNP